MEAKNARIEGKESLEEKEPISIGKAILFMSFLPSIYLVGKLISPLF